MAIDARFPCSEDLVRGKRDLTLSARDTCAADAFILLAGYVENFRNYCVTTGCPPRRALPNNSIFDPLVCKDRQLVEDFFLFYF